MPFLYSVVVIAQNPEIWVRSMCGLKRWYFDSIRRRRGVIDCQLVESNPSAWFELPVFWQHVQLSETTLSFTLFTLHYHTCICIYTMVSHCPGQAPMGARSSRTNIEGEHEGGALMLAQEWVFARDNTVFPTEVKIVPHDLCSPLQWLWPSLLNVSTTSSDWLQTSSILKQSPRSLLIFLLLLFGGC